MGGSGLIPGWKVKRELSRLGQQLRAIPEAVWEPFARRAHDAALDRGFPITEGNLQPGPKFALVLCWQPKGLAGSFFDLLDHLVSSGYTPFVVSNAALVGADREALKSRIWRAVERPNFGYDFGGYRDGLRLLRRWRLHPDRLVIMNDSIWYPLWAGDQTLRHAEATPFDVTGMFLRQRNATWFLESYFFSIKGAVLDHPDFLAFWDGLRLTSNKYKVIRQGERGFGAALQAAGVSMGPLFPMSAFEKVFSEYDETELRRVLNYMAAVDPGVAAERDELVAAPPAPDWPDKARAFVKRVLHKAQPYSAFPVAAASLGYPVLKKSLEPVSAEWRAAFLRAVDEAVLPQPLPSVLQEARARQGRHSA